MYIRTYNGIFNPNGTIIQVKFAKGVHFTAFDLCSRRSVRSASILTGKSLYTGTPQLNPIPVKSLWYMVGIDFVGPILRAVDDGSGYILTATDYFTKWCEAVPTVDKSAA